MDIQSIAGLNPLRGGMSGINGGTNPIQQLLESLAGGCGGCCGKGGCCGGGCCGGGCCGQAQHAYNRGAGIMGR